MKKIVLGVLILVLFVAGYFLFLYITVEQVPVGQNSEVESWQIYRSDKYKFEIQYPNDWKVIYEESPAGPYFHFLRQDDEIPYDGARVSLYPQGRTGHGPPGESRKIFTDVTAAKANSVWELFLSNSGQPWGYVIFDFIDAPTEWNGEGLVDSGSIWAQAGDENLKIECRIKGCSPIEDGLVVIGEVNMSDFETIKKILSTFRFID